MKMLENIKMCGNDLKVLGKYKMLGTVKSVGGESKGVGEVLGVLGRTQGVGWVGGVGWGGVKKDNLEAERRAHSHPPSQIIRNT